MSKRYSGKSFKDSSVMKKPRLSLKEKRKLKREKRKKITRKLTKPAPSRMPAPPAAAPFFWASVT